MNRFSRPWLSFIYKLHGYSSVVGPLRSHLFKSYPVELLNNSVTRLRFSNAKPRTHPLLRNDRPAIVGLADIVRDAVARLPNGEGTRWDIVTLAKDSGFLIPRINDRQLHQCISGALDRLQSEPDTPVVYRPSRKVWVYKHRHRTPESFMKIFKQQSLMHQAKRNLKRAKTMENKAIPEKRQTAEETTDGNLMSFKYPNIQSQGIFSQENVKELNSKDIKINASNSTKKNEQYITQKFASYNETPSIPDIDDLLRSNDPDLNPEILAYEIQDYCDSDSTGSSNETFGECK